MIVSSFSLRWSIMCGRFLSIVFCCGGGQMLAAIAQMSSKPRKSRNAHRISLAVPPSHLRSTEFINNPAPLRFPMLSCEWTISVLRQWPKALSNGLVVVQNLETKSPSDLAYSSTITSSININFKYSCSPSLPVTVLNMYDITSV